MAVDDLSLEAPSGKITVLVGPSGCGKTTSLRMINRMIRPTSRHDHAGRQGHRADEGVRAAPRHRLRHPARRPLPAPHRPRQRRRPSRACWAWTRPRPRKRSMELLERVGLDPAFAKRYPAQLSGGQQQRVGVARALAADPPVMLMDEPFSAVDPVVREQLQDEFLRLQGDLGKTIVFVTHDIDEAIKLGDQVAVLQASVARSPSSPSPPTCCPTRSTTSWPTSSGATAATARCPSSRRPRLPLASGAHRRAWASASTASTPTGCSWSTSDNHPLGWVEPARINGEVRSEMLHRGGTVARGQRPAARRPRRRAVQPEPARRDRRRHRRPGGHGQGARGAHRHRGDRAAPSSADPDQPGAPAA